MSSMLEDLAKAAPVTRNVQVTLTEEVMGDLDQLVEITKTDRQRLIRLFIVRGIAALDDELNSAPPQQNGDVQ